MNPNNGSKIFEQQRKDNLKIEALRQANQVVGEPAAIVKRATAFLKFLSR